MNKSSEQINRALTRLFDKHRIIFWYDDQSELRRDFDAIDIEGVEKVVVHNNEFALKYRMLREQADRRFLVYREGPEPPPIDNWLLDVQLSGEVFSTDQATIWLTELGLPYDLKPVVQGHEAFFNAAKRRDPLKRRLSGKPTPSIPELRRHMLAVCAGCPTGDSRLDTILEHLLEELAASDGESDRHDRMLLIKKCGLDDFLFDQMRSAYSYDCDTPSIDDFQVQLFKSAFQMGISTGSSTGNVGNSSSQGDVILGSEALVFLKRWKDNRNHESSFQELSRGYESAFKVQNDLEHCNADDLIDMDFFRLIDVKILSDLIRSVIDRTITSDRVKVLTRSRRSSHWYSEFEHIYMAIDYAAEFNQLLDALSIQIESLTQGVTAYVESLFRIDQLYRKFIYHSNKASQVTLFQDLKTQVCNKYTNAFLLPLGDCWQQRVDDAQTWSIPNVTPQRHFFRRHVNKFLDKNNKVYVIISDAMRYEVGEELVSRMRQEDRFEADIDHMLTGLPSYTQLGMAALLPHESLQINDDKSSTVDVDKVSSSGLANRDKILKASAERDGRDVRARTISAKDLLDFNKDQTRELVRDHDVVYIYQNRIDKVGHSRDTEKRAFAETEETLDELQRIVTKLTSANATNLLITADHGFIYQDDVDESDYSMADPSVGEVLQSDRRFVIGRELVPADGIRCYEASDVGLDGDLKVVIPKSINRFRKKGAATRFVHGGSSLQEVIVPVVHVRKSKASTTKLVEVNLLPSSTSTISTGQLALAFYQVEPVSDKIRPRTLEIGLWCEGEPISDVHQLTFDLTSDNPRDREQKIRLVLAKEADAHNGKQVDLKMRERFRDTTQFHDYKTSAFRLQRSFATDFDDFG